MTEVSTAGAGTTALDWEDLEPGTEIEVSRAGEVVHRGVVEEAAATLRVAWIRDSATGERRLIGGEILTLHRR